MSSASYGRQPHPYGNEDLRVDMQDVLAGMPQSLRQVCELRMAHSLSEAAGILGVSKSTLHRSLRSARAFFRGQA